MVGNRNFKQAFWASRKVRKKSPGGNRANQRFQDGSTACEKGHTSSWAKDVAKHFAPLLRVGWGNGQRGSGGTATVSRLFCNFIRIEIAECFRYRKAG